MRTTLTLLLVLSLGLVACGDDSTEPPVNTFSLQMQVLRPDGTPVEGLTVAMWNMSESLAAFLQDVVPKRRAATRVDFALPQRSICSLNSYDLEGKLLQSVFEADTLEAGRHAVVLGAGIDYNAGVKVMRYELVAQDPETGAELFRDAKYMTPVHLDIQRMTNGKTDAEGRFEIDDRTVVPGLYDLGEQPAVNENGEIMGHFTLDALLTVRFYDELGNYVRVQQTVVDGANTIKATWDQAALEQDPNWNATTEPGMMTPGHEWSTGDVPLPETEFMLEQNSPNPFN